MHKTAILKALTAGVGSAFKGPHGALANGLCTIDGHALPSSRSPVSRRSRRVEDCTPSQSRSRGVADLRALYTATRGFMVP